MSKNLYKVKWTETHEFEAEVYAENEDEAVGLVSQGVMVSAEQTEEWTEWDDAEAELLEEGEDDDNDE
jgi:hypothetical protein